MTLLTPGSSPELRPVESGGLEVEIFKGEILEGGILDPQSFATPSPVPWLIVYHRTEGTPAWEALVSDTQRSLLHQVVSTTLAHAWGAPHPAQDHAPDPGSSGESPAYAPCEISFLWTTDQLMAGYNQQFRGKAGPTNVLSFPSYTREDLLHQQQSRSHSDAHSLGPLPLGDVVIALETVHQQAQDSQRPFWHHLIHLVVHGVLHLVGYDHQQDGEAHEMESLETRLLVRWGIDDPYAAYTGSAPIHNDN